ncbi:LANO_0F11738g1_1 [Lachancea nothofagi CBS 11611]|uniref:LANO_0F11738g1_1 n=1 Tax=Lachancea nothofagi CBS 11611 TaxID=1266666 RepID=A0A1G4KB77_9SACH|nr:LANO_0F11738g1_1 [Lachancea nothofagi CBS 11611]
MHNGSMTTEIDPLRNIDERLTRTAVESEIAPVIEIATYAGVDVYECYCRGQESRIVMRRCLDNWVNITQVFKIASFSKTQRTKILEKESNMIKHEKIQGGYGRFQGTWIPLENALYLVEKYNVNDLVVSTILNFLLDPTNPPARRSKNSVIKKQSPGTKIQSPSSYNKTPKKSGAGAIKKHKKKLASSMGNAVHAAAAVKKSQVHPSPLQNLAFQTPQHQQHHSMQHNNSTVIAPDQQTPLHPTDYETTQKPLQFYPYPQQQPAFLTFDSNNINQQHPIKKPKKVGKNSSSSQFQAQHSFRVIKQQFMDQRNLHSARSIPHAMVTIHPQPTTHKTSHSNGSNGSNGSSIECFSAREEHSPISSRSTSPKLRQQQEPDAKSEASEERTTEEEYKEILLQVLSSDYSANGSDTILLPDELYHPPLDLDINFTIDDQGHTTLHWAAAMANVPLIKVIQTLPVNISLCNHRGFNAITKACFYNNCFKAGVFPKVLELLKPCTITPDMNGRLPLHYLVELSVNKSKDPVVINYYLDSLLDTLAQEDVSLLRMCLNHQDNAGNTVLHLAALNLNLELCNKLCYMGSSMTILNLEHETATSILARFNLVPPTSQELGGAIPELIEESETQKSKQLRLSTPVMTRKKNGSFTQVDDQTVNLTQELSSISSIPDSFADSSRIKSPRGMSSLAIPDPLSVSSTVHKGIKPTAAIPLIKLERARSSQTLTKQLSNLTASLTNSVDEEISGLELEKEKVQGCIESVDNSLKNNKQLMQEILQGLPHSEQLHDDVFELSKQLESHMALLANSIEKSQALALATWVHEEESTMTSNSTSPHKDGITNSPVRVIGEHLLRLGLQLTLLQFSRKHTIERLSRSKSEIGSTPKIKKYRKLIGTTIEDIDSKLDDIEKDLRASI